MSRLSDPAVSGWRLGKVPKDPVRHGKRAEYRGLGLQVKKAGPAGLNLLITMA